MKRRKVSEKSLMKSFVKSLDSIIKMIEKTKARYEEKINPPAKKPVEEVKTEETPKVEPVAENKPVATESVQQPTQENVTPQTLPVNPPMAPQGNQQSVPTEQNPPVSQNTQQQN